jgi:methyl-accepting chemotaxis protein
MFTEAPLVARLALGLGVTFMFLLLIGGVTAYATAQFAARVNQIGEQNTRGTEYLARIEGALWELQQGVAQYIIEPDLSARARIVRDSGRWVAAVDENIKALYRTTRTEADAAALAEFAGHYRRYVESRPRWFELFGAGAFEEAADWRSRTVHPSSRAMMQALDRLVDLRQQSNDQVQLQAFADANRLRFLLIAGLVIAVLVTVTAAMGMSRGITLPLADGVAVAAANDQACTVDAAHWPAGCDDAMLAGARSGDSFTRS